MADYPDYAYILFDHICNIIGPSDEWPKRILELFWSREIKHWDHFVLSAFVVINGLNPDMFLEWIDMIGLAKDENSLREFKSLLQTFMKESAKWNRVYAYHILNHRFKFISGEVKFYLPMDKKRPEW